MIRRNGQAPELIYECHSKGSEYLGPCDISVLFLINLQKCQQFCVFLSIWGAVCTLMRKKMNLNDLANSCNITKSETFRGSEYFPTVYLK